MAAGLVGVVTPPPIRLKDLTLSYERHPAVHHVSGCFEPGSLTAVIGPNGAGKTTLLRAIAGVHPIDTGSIDRGGLRPREIALMPQVSDLDRNFPVTCFDVVSMGLVVRAGPWRSFRRAERQAVTDALRVVGLRGFETRLVAGLSAGQFQRVLFARAVVQDAPVLLLDEPFASVDGETTDDLLRVVAGWHAEGRTVIVVIHDLDLARAFFPQALLLARDLIAWGPSGDALRPEMIARARLASEAWAEHADICRPAA